MLKVKLMGIQQDCSRHRICKLRNHTWTAHKHAGADSHAHLNAPTDRHPYRNTHTDGHTHRNAPTDSHADCYGHAHHGHTDRHADCR